MKTEEEICDWLYERYKAGAKRFDAREISLHRPNTIAALMDLLGWCYQDQRRAHMRHHEEYRLEQERIDRVVQAIQDEVAEEEQRDNGQFGVGA